MESTSPSSLTLDKTPYASWYSQLTYAIRAYGCSGIDPINQHADTILKQEKEISALEKKIAEFEKQRVVKKNGDIQFTEILEKLVKKIVDLQKEILTIQSGQQELQNKLSEVVNSKSLLGEYSKELEIKNQLLEKTLEEQQQLGIQNTNSIQEIVYEENSQEEQLLQLTEEQKIVQTNLQTQKEGLTQIRKHLSGIGSTVDALKSTSLTSHQQHLMKLNQSKAQYARNKASLEKRLGRLEEKAQTYVNSKSERSSANSSTTSSAYHSEDEES
jgi:chromosome segregation ATPase